jgi:hypothetical protein
MRKRVCKGMAEAEAAPATCVSELDNFADTGLSPRPYGAQGRYRDREHESQVRIIAAHCFMQLAEMVGFGGARCCAPLPPATGMLAHMLHGHVTSRDGAHAQWSEKINRQRRFTLSIYHLGASPRVVSTGDLPIRDARWINPFAVQEFTALRALCDQRTKADWHYSPAPPPTLPTLPAIRKSGYMWLVVEIGRSTPYSIMVLEMGK